MATVNERIREAVRVELARRGESQSQLAERVGVSRQYLSDVMRGRAGNVPALWQKVLEDLGLELVVQPKTRSDG
jgi:transcriptional regulator with XRE-family HTH domain